MSIPFDWQLLFLRLLVIALLYLFLYQIARVTLRELSVLSRLEANDRGSAAASPRAYLVVVDPANSSLPAGTTFPLPPVAVLGRHPACDVALDDTSVSAQHAELTATDDGWWLRDLGSTNGTFVNGQEVVVPTDVREGDIVQCGRVKLQIVC
ncbi:MAG TPA: FHA domain-containing protein [Thermomicrobiales bacterium]